MAITPTYSWPIPDDTDLVKDGAEAIRDLGNAIDTTVSGLGSGLVHINTTSFSAVASQSINDVFSATYKNYKIVIDLVASTSIAFRARLRVSGADNSTASSYTSQEVRGSTTTAAAFQTVDSLFQFGYANTNPSVIELSLINPFETSNTSFACFGGRNDRSASVSGFHNQSVSYTGITLIPESGTITGTARIYGLKD